MMCKDASRPEVLETLWIKQNFLEVVRISGNISDITKLSDITKHFEYNKTFRI